MNIKQHTEHDDPTPTRLAPTALVGRWRVTLDGRGWYRLQRRKWLIWRTVGEYSIIGWTEYRWQNGDDAWQRAHDIEECERLNLQRVVMV